MISQTCLIAPTGVPVDVMTHCAWPFDPPWGTCNELPAGQLVLGGAADDAVVPTIAVETPTPESAIVAIAAAAIAVDRIGRRFVIEIRTQPPSHETPQVRAT
jgi:hypothetical protein